MLKKYENRLLSREFLSKYPDFPEHMTQIGKFVYLRTYSRWIPEEQRRETWKETCRRAVEYNCALAETPKKEAERLFDNMFNLKQALSGRTLWVGGTEVAEKYPLSNFNCFRRDTEFLTKEGIKTFYDFEDGDIVEVLNGNGAWSPSVVRNYGKQKLLKLVVQRQGTKYTEDIYVTGNHVWFVKKGNEKRYVEVTTSNLKAGDKLRRKVRYENTNLNMCNIGIQHGIVFGDGTFDKKKGHCRVSLIGKKQDYVKYFNNATTSTEGDRDSILVYGLPYYFKDLPPISANVEYIKGFLYGLLLTDGRLGSSVRLGQKDLEVVKQLQSMCEIIGLTTSKIVEVVRTNNNFGDYENTYEFTIHKETLRKHDMLVSKADELEWVVKEVTETDLLEDVWCVEEPKTNSFTLRGGIHTHNCAYVTMDSIEAIKDLFYLLMVGTGVGFRILKSDVAKFPKVKQGIKLTHKKYNPVPESFRDEFSSLRFDGKSPKAKIIVGDSKEGWIQALNHYFELVTNTLIRIDEIEVVYDSVRPKGERLKTFGGTASGHESLQTMFQKIHNVINTDMYAPRPVDGVLRPIHLLDICNIIGENVVVGGVRRTSEIALLDATDRESIEAKSNLTPEKYHRFMSNNSIYYTEKPTREQIKWQFSVLKDTGEPCFVNAEAGKKRNPYMQGVNPCVEILLDSHQTCNLTTINVLSFVKENNGKKFLDIEGIVEAQRLSARAGLRMTEVKLELPKWDYKQKRDRLLGCSLTGFKDAIEALGYNKKQELELQKLLGEVAREEANKYAEELGINQPLLVTAVKPEGTLSQVFGGVSSGLHHAHSPYYIRRVRINAHDPLCKTLEECGWELKNESGQGEEFGTPVMTKVIEFPMYSPAKRTKYDVSAIEQLETYYNFQKNYTEHNSSNTISVKDHEWEEVEQNIWENWDDMVAVSFLKLDGHVYDLAPYEAITKEKYEKMLGELPGIDIEVLKKHEVGNSDEADIGENDECVNGICPIR